MQANELSAAAPLPSNKIRVTCQTLSGTLPTGVLAAIGFGADARREDETTLCIQVALQPLHGQRPEELWWAQGPVQRGTHGAIRYASDAHHLFGVIELDEREHSDIASAAAAAYTAITDFQRQCAFPHLLRMWNYFDAINAGVGDLERYRQFCIGRARGLNGLLSGGTLPAATAIGHQHTTHRLQIFWLASRAPGKAIENPRQLSAYRYPRLHGPVSPSFARAMVSDGAVLISGTASLVGHSSLHDDDVIAQLDETLRNLNALRTLAPAHGATDSTLLKVYVRDAGQADLIAQRLRSTLPAQLQTREVICLAADICRRELLLEIEGVQLRDAARHTDL